ncbi:hypothetical protein PRZ48_007708 [Zasmidium cellare]|uniref:Zn(2)-C6 fungal-type domain-containing protein n=1 Tax=Zasmidium cellare TaxID=395010 RepID=A0ABR0EKH3_ZASCE|nr:hypothetical protein PRZ48_007708 [Zasmidium cellare]
MPSRRFHGKTRSGCASCKARHVKCGEERPVCKNCIRRNTSCVYPSEGSPESNSKPERSPVAAGSVGDSFDGLDLTLMHRYSTVTSLCLLPSSGAQRVWQTEIPSTAREYPLLQHGMLALAAMDLACAAADEGEQGQMALYRARGLHHQGVALPMFRSLLLRDDHREQNVIFIFSIMLVMLAFASAQSAPTPPTLDEILDMFALFRGPRALWEMHQNGANKELIQTLFPKALPDRPDLPEAEFMNPDNPMIGIDHPDIDQSCAQAVEQIRWAWARHRNDQDDVRAMAWFPALMPQGFYEQCQEHRPIALAILNLYASILKPFHNRWWISSWDVILSSAIKNMAIAEHIRLPVLVDPSRM